MRSLIPSRIGNTFVMYISEYVKCGPRTELRPELPNWQLVTELTLRAQYAGIAGPCCRIDHRDECVGVEPLFGSVNGDAGIGSLAIERRAGHPVGIVRHGELDGLRGVGRLKHAVAIVRYIAGSAR